MLRDLRRADDLTSGGLRWGILTNGACWRLCHQGAQSVSEQFLEFDFLNLLGLSGHGEGLFALTEDDRCHCLRVVTLAFRRDAFLPSASDSRTFHQRAIDEGRFYEKRVADDLSELVFGKVFPELAQAIAAKAPQAPLAEVRDATLVLLYRLLFILYAEDRDLLPVRDYRYDDYALREKVRGDVGRRMGMGDTFSAVAARYSPLIPFRFRGERRGLMQRKACRAAGCGSKAGARRAVAGASRPQGPRFQPRTPARARNKGACGPPPLARRR